MPADLNALVAIMPFAEQLGLVLDEASPDRVVARLDWAPHLCTSGGIMHGGVLMSLADTAGALVTFLGEAIDRDAGGFLITSPMMETSVPGVFAAGDVRSGSTKQLGSAVGDGIAALLLARCYLEAHHHKAVPSVPIWD